jgi:hypothetical protein
MLLRVVRTFLDKFGQSTSRQDLLIEFQSSNDLNDLSYRHILKTYVPTADEYLPTALAFHYCGDAEREDQARKAVQILAKVLRKQFLSRRIKLSREGLEEDAREIDPLCDQRTIELGIYLGSEFNLFQSYAGGNEAQPVITPTRISEQIVDVKSPDTLWDDFMRQRKLWPERDSSVDVAPATLLPTVGASGEIFRAPEKRFTRDQKIALVGVALAVIAIVVSLTDREIRRVIGLDKSQHTNTDHSDPAVHSNVVSPQQADDSNTKTPGASPVPGPAPKDWMLGDWFHVSKTLNTATDAVALPIGCTYTEESTDEFVVSKNANLVTGVLSVSQKRSPTGIGNCGTALQNAVCNAEYEARLAPTADSNVWSLDAIPKQNSCGDLGPAFSGSITRLSAVALRLDSAALHLEEVLSRKHW